MGEQGVPERAENAPWWRPVKVQDPVSQGGVETQGLNDELGGYYGVKC